MNGRARLLDLLRPAGGVIVAGVAETAGRPLPEVVRAAVVDAGCPMTDLGLFTEPGTSAELLAGVLGVAGPAVTSPGGELVALRLARAALTGGSCRVAVACGDPGAVVLVAAPAGRTAQAGLPDAVLSDTDTLAGVVRARVTSRTAPPAYHPVGGTTVFLLAGLGSQHFHMGGGPRRVERVFRDELDRLDAVVAPEAGESVVARLYDPRVGPAEVFDDPVLTSPAVVMVELALAALLRHRGVEPDLLVGASLGEFTAAVLAGALDEAACLRALVRHARSPLVAPSGGMLAVLADDTLHEQVPALRDGTEIAARYQPGHFVVSGSAEALDAAERDLRDLRVPCRRLPVRHAFHSRLLDDTRESFLRTVAAAGLREPRLPVVSCATAGPVDRLTAEHLWRATRAPIEFTATLAGLERTGPHHYVDLSPAGTLHGIVRALLPTGSRSRSRGLLTHLGDDVRASDDLRARPAAPARRARRRVVAFPGQGAQAKGMGADLFDAFPEHVAAVDDVLGYSIRELCLRDPGRALRSTEYAQPALYVVCALSYLHGGHRPDVLVGHSLGEYAALFAAGAFDFETGLRLVQGRGRLMARATGGGMAAVVGLDLARLERLLAEQGLDELDVANHNAPEQHVLAGPDDALDRARPVVERAHGRWVRLGVSAPFHSRYMRPAAEEFAVLLDDVELRDPLITVLSSVDGEPYRPGGVKEVLARQMTSPVRWTDTVDRLLADGDVEFVEVGPGRTLTALVEGIRAAGRVPRNR
ncbi:ACP S-malonyltransferase [Actinosynnema sp. CA-299493]